MPQQARAAPMRLFFALVPPPGIQGRLGELAQAIASDTLGRPVPAHNVHATLAFLGHVDAQRAPGLLMLGGRTAGESFALSLNRVGWFRQARVAWIAPHAVPLQLTHLQADLERLLGSAGFALDPRPFNPHLTLARHCARGIERNAVDAIDWTVEHFALMQSLSTQDGVRYEALATWPLRRS
ncbi:MAG TPA: RNA 2',3'-cyclic phosphodiesterase [Casimicrobiaceae bacterium]|nr:RNA 2',3'-cyclic phosphodiesterase [Casimicrobiaceae bacterium]